MPYFHYQHNQLHVEEVPLEDIAQQFGTPCYVYSHAALTDNWHAFENAFHHFPHQICYAVKANSNLAILNLFSKKRCGFDIVSRGELERVLAARGDPEKIIFSGVGKQAAEIVHALEVGIGCFNVESEAELECIQSIGVQQNKVVHIALRINPNIDARTHPYIATGLKENKFGIEFKQALPLVKKIQTMSHIKLIGIACHIGSQITELNPFLAAVDRLAELIEPMLAAGAPLEHINLGGGLGVRYQQENPPSIQEYISALKKKLEKYALKIILEPGRSIVANAGILLTRVEYLKQTSHKNFAIVDAAMNDFMRPALYDAWHDIIPITLSQKSEAKNYDIVGPICESADFFGKNRQLVLLQAGNLLAICDTGAYGTSMSSNYNSRPRAAEVMVNKNKIYLIRQREIIDDLFAHEFLIEE